MDILGIKIIVLILIAVIKFGSGMLPMVVLPRLRRMGIKKRKLDKFMAGILCVGGGALLATVFVHMIPEVRESFDTAMERLKGDDVDGHEGHDHENHDPEGHNHEEHEGHVHEKEHGYPFAELFVCAGFFFIYLIEAVVHKVFLSKMHHGHGHGGGGHGHSHAIPQHMLEGEEDAKDPERYAV